jgi:SAM-dependent methyltransferase
MSSCCASVCGPIAAQFDMPRAEGDVKQYKTKGPNPTTRQLRDGIVRAGAGQTVLDVGAGIGAASFELLAAGFATAFTVDASPAYVAVARREAQARGLAGRMTILEGDFLAASATVPAADAVVMDRVVCCYPDYRPLLEQALQRGNRLFAFSYPRDRWYVRLVVALENLWRAVTRNAFRAVVHSATAMEDLILANGFRRASRTGTLAWCVDVYLRGTT